MVIIASDHITFSIHVFLGASLYAFHFFLCRNMETQSRQVGFGPVYKVIISTHICAEVYENISFYALIMTTRHQDPNNLIYN